VARLLGWLYEDEYSPELGSVVLRDAMAEGERRLAAPLLDEHAGGLWGTVARAGAGWSPPGTPDQDLRLALARPALRFPDGGGLPTSRTVGGG
jgi:hypothetical protein